MSYMLTLEEIEIKKQELERHLADVMAKELSKWQLSNKLCSVHDKFHRTLILSGFCLLKIAKIS
ncbi:hypothetical protein KSB01_19695, partial [Acinetobacter baumannii]|nr:hypothetical protein [Acinetobacter baumannii]